MTDFIETPSFPQCPSFGYTARPQISVTPVATASGHERRNRNWRYALLEYSCTVGPRAQEDIEELTEFWYAMGGIECGFRFKDWIDFKSCKLEATVSPVDQPLVVNADSPGGYQLMKRYTFGARTYIRKIVKPVQGTIIIADAAVLKTEGADYSIDYATGIVQLGFSPSGALTWGGEFDVAARFNSEFPVSLTDYKIQSVAFELRELRDFS